MAFAGLETASKPALYEVAKILSEVSDVEVPPQSSTKADLVTVIAEYMPDLMDYYNHTIFELKDCRHRVYGNRQ